MFAQILQNLFIQPATINGYGRLGMLLPLTLAISIVYKTIRCEDLRAVPLASLRLCITIVVTMLLIGAGLLVIFHLLA